jgi:hypothetical protein
MKANEHVMGKGTIHSTEPVSVLTKDSAHCQGILRSHNLDDRWPLFH